MRTLRLLTLGLRMLMVLAAIPSTSSFGALVAWFQVPVGLLRGAVVGQRLAGAGDERLDRVREVNSIDVVIAPLHAQLVRLEQNLGVGEAVRWLEPVGSELDQEAERILEVDRIHEAT